MMVRIALLWVVAAKLYPIATGLIVRYAALFPSALDPNSDYLWRVALPMLRSSICLAERYFKPALTKIASDLPNYVVYTDTVSHAPVASMLHSEFSVLKLQRRLKLINLDDFYHFSSAVKATIDNLQLNSVNSASLQRTLADSVYLPSHSGRLLLGLDVSFVSEAHELAARIAQLNSSQALYMADLTTFNKLYRVTNYDGPQCPGLLGDFVYLGPGLKISFESIKDKALWFAEQPRMPERISPPTWRLALPKANGLHGIDQFALNLALAEAVVPQGQSGCFPLHKAKHMHLGHYSRRFFDMEHVEVIHDKVISSCGSQHFDTCALTQTFADVPISPLQVFDDRQSFDSGSSLSQHYLSCESESCFWTRTLELGEVFVLLASTLCHTEEHLTLEWNSIRSHFDVDETDMVLPRYDLYVDDLTCGDVSIKLDRHFANLAHRLKLINLEKDPLKNQRTLHPGISACALPRLDREKFLALRVTFRSHPEEASVMLRALNQSKTVNLHLLDMIESNMVKSSREPSSWLDLSVFFCLCGTKMDLPCP
eukprot:TRINITY_DN116774_c0_g1_i1.p1 TRINITY_DN116774_c0_g1~~TRINITY_DN116774_c0_g1_i1.p1  ORF type:complete len:541 (-),score=56.78 TRINITY_DN116774_c0_g1_i1:164-1786(-)